MDKTLEKLNGVRKLIERAFIGICVFLGFVLLLLLTANVFVRIFPIASLHWFDEIVEFCFAWLIFLGAAVLFSRRDHFKIEWFLDKSKGTRLEFPHRLFIELVCLAFVFLFLYYSFKITMRVRDLTSVLNLPRKLFYASMPLAGLLMIYAGIIDLIQLITGMFTGKTT